MLLLTALFLFFSLPLFPRCAFCFWVCLSKHRSSLRFTDDSEVEPDGETATQLEKHAVTRAKAPQRLICESISSSEGGVSVCKAHVYNDKASCDVRAEWQRRAAGRRLDGCINRTSWIKAAFCFKPTVNIDFFSPPPILLFSNHRFFIIIGLMMTKFGCKVHYSTPPWLIFETSFCMWRLKVKVVFATHIGVNCKLCKTLRFIMYERDPVVGPSQTLLMHRTESRAESMLWWFCWSKLLTLNVNYKL